MSTNWGYRCPTHEAGNAYMYGGSGDYGKLQLLELWRERDMYQRLSRLSVEFLYAVASDDYRSSEAIIFVGLHADCPIIIEDEYGAQYDPARDSTLILRRQGDITRDLEKLVKDAEAVSPSDRMTVYVGDLRAILYGTDAVKAKTGTNNGTSD